MQLLSYIRVSAVRGREGPGFISPSDQAERNRAYATAYGHTIVEEGQDLDKSGGDMSRPTFDRFMCKIRAGEADGLIVAKLDRFARSNKGALEAIEDLESHGGVLISVAEQIDPTTASGRFMRNVLLATAQWERDRIGEQWLTARTRAVARGIHVARNVPPGYVRGSKTDDPRTDRRLKPHRKHAATIRHAYEMAAAGEPDARIADYLNERKLPITSVKEGEKSAYWWSSRVPRLLANRVYLGEARSGKGIVLADAHPALVDEQTWLLAQRANSSTQRLRKPNRDAQHPPAILSGIVRCASCSFAMRSQPARGNSLAVYRCGTSTVHGRCEAPTTVSKTRLEEYVLQAFVAEAESRFVGSRRKVDAKRRKLLDEVTMAEKQYRAALVNVSLRAKIGDADHDDLVGSLHDAWREKRDALNALSGSPSAIELPQGVSLGELVERLMTERRHGELRGLVEVGIEAVFVRPAKSRAHNLPIADRVHIVFRGSEPTLDLPKRGRRFEPRPFVW